jgi:predicted CXXCH cytochrome family protein
MYSGNLTNAVTGSANIGGSDHDMTDDHPIGFDFQLVSVQDERIRTLAEAKSRGAAFYPAGAKNNQMECASCHDVHNNTLPGEPFFLRSAISGNGGNLCLICHKH